MFCMLWVIFQCLALVVEGGVSSGSAEVPLNARVNHNGAAAGNNANGAPNGVPLIGELLVAHVVQVGGSFFIQPNQPGQAPLQQVIPIVAPQSGGVNVNSQGQVIQPAASGPVTLFAVLTQRNAGGDPQLISVAGLNSQRQPGPSGGNLLGRARLQRSVAAHRRRTQSPVMMVRAAEEEEESSGMETEEEEAK